LALQTLFEGPGLGAALPLPDELARLYGKLSFQSRRDGPLILGNFVSTLDGVVSLDAGKSGGGAISGENQQDLMVMGLLRAAADVVIEGAGTLRAAPKGILTAAHVFPRLEKAYAELRQRLGKAATPLNVIVSASGNLDLGLRIFQSGEVRALILTSPPGEQRLAAQGLPPSVEVRALRGAEGLGSAALVQSLGLSRGQVLLVEGGPHLMGSFIKDRQLHELFLTLAPQVAGRDEASRRPGFVSGQSFAPADPRWGDLIGVKRGQSHLFLRYDLMKT
jgi:riboflavin biosynthesis pyrimidine reductase